MILQMMVHVSICGTDKDRMAEGNRHDHRRSYTDFEEGQVSAQVTVVSIKEFGAFLEFAPGKEGMVHISKISKESV